MNRNRINEYYVSLPDNEGAFFAFVNLVINNRDNANVPQYADTRPNDFGPVKNVNSVTNEVGEHFLIAHSLKDKKFLEMLVDQFTLLRTHWGTITNFVKYPNSDIYKVD